MKKLFLVVILALFIIGTANAADIVGKWKTISDISGKANSSVEIVEVDGKLNGKIVKFYNDNPNHDPICHQCKDHLKNKKMKGMQIIYGLTLKDGKWVGDKSLLDPDTGNYYDVKMWIDEKDPNKLNVRGYFSMLHRTQTWIREK